MKITTRLKNIEASIEIQSKYTPIVVAIEKNVYYDELPSDEQKSLYCEYIGIDREIFENINLTVLGDLHIILRKIETPTDKELELIIEEANQKVLG